MSPTPLFTPFWATLVVGGSFFLINSATRRNQLATLYNEIYQTREEIKELKKGLLTHPNKK